MQKLHIGCGDIYFKGWTNVDLESNKADLKWNMLNPLPYKHDSIDFIYNEHFIEHLTVEEGLGVIKNFHKILKQGGALRIATIDLDYIVHKYNFFWKNQDWIKTHKYQWIKTKAEMMNICFHEWGHKYLYNEEELKRRLEEAGFKKIKSVKFNKSGFEELKNRETRKDSKLILEAIK